MHSAMSQPGVTRSKAFSTLLENYRLFLAFLERRVGTKADAEDILQTAFVKMMESPARFPKEERVVVWLYRVLRNALGDHYRRRDAEQTAHRMAARGAEPSSAPELDPELEGAVCRCVTSLSRDPEAAVRRDPRRGGVARREVNGGGPVRQEMTRGRSLTGAAGGWLYSARVPAIRPATELYGASDTTAPRCCGPPGGCSNPVAGMTDEEMISEDDDVSRRTVGAALRRVIQMTLLPPLTVWIVQWWAGLGAMKGTS